MTDRASPDTVDAVPGDERPIPARVGMVPGAGAFGPGIARFDQWADDLLERVRGNPIADRVFPIATTLGEFSVIWHLTNLVRGVTGIGRPKQIPALAVLLSLESLVVNQGIKRIFGRTRPTTEGDPRFEIRRPLTSSFPSGHASSAAFTATLLTGWDGCRKAPLWWGLAGIVATSRAYVRIHHASDVVAGLVTGTVLGLGARRLLRRVRLD